MTAPSLVDYEDRVKEAGDRAICRSCDADLRGEPVRSYPHSGGWPVAGVVGLQWLYVTCPGCGIERSLNKMGIARLVLAEVA